MGEGGARRDRNRVAMSISRILALTNWFGVDLMIRLELSYCCADRVHRRCQYPFPTKADNDQLDFLVHQLQSGSTMVDNGGHFPSIPSIFQIPKSARHTHSANITNRKMHFHPPRIQNKAMIYETHSDLDRSVKIDEFWYHILQVITFAPGGAACNYIILNTKFIIIG